jgi:hypothetical protein
VLAATTTATVTYYIGGANLNTAAAKTTLGGAQMTAFLQAAGFRIRHSQHLPSPSPCPSPSPSPNRPEPLHDSPAPPHVVVRPHHPIP